MATRILLRRIPLLRPLRPPNDVAPRSHLLQLGASLSSRSRPHMPFLSPAKRRPIVRFLTTETKQWLKSEVKKGLKISSYLYIGTALFVIVALGVTQEMLERRYPSPQEWSFLSHFEYRNAKINEESYGTDAEMVDWEISLRRYVKLLKRLEDPHIDGAGLRKKDDGESLASGASNAGLDISAKSDRWRRAYFEVLMGAARAAEYLDSWVVDRTRTIFFPANVVVGLSNPSPHPVPPGAPPAPKEEDCDPAADPPETFYKRILTTDGFTDTERLDAALACAAWLDIKGAHTAAAEMHTRAIDIALGDRTPPMIDHNTGVLDTSAGLPTNNMLAASTALAIHHATTGNLSMALPAFLSILRARRALPDVPKEQPLPSNQDEDNSKFVSGVKAVLKAITSQPDFQYEPDKGGIIPCRDAEERCEEAAIMMYIGEILYASQHDKKGREDGLAWTREAVDIAEEQIRASLLEGSGKARCKQCLDLGLNNWQKMVTKLSREEQSVSSQGIKTWLGFGSDGQKIIGRWQSEEQVVKQRQRRVSDIFGKSVSDGIR